MTAHRIGCEAVATTQRPLREGRLSMPNEEFVRKAHEIAEHKESEEA
jgi:hypothetical protein